MGVSRADDGVVTSKMLCLCLDLEWGPVIPQSFDGIGAAILVGWLPTPNTPHIHPGRLVTHTQHTTHPSW